MWRAPGMFGQSLTALKRVDDLVKSQTHRLLITIPALLLLYIKYRQDQDACAEVWHQVLQSVASPPDEIETTLPVLLDAIENDSASDVLHSQGELDEAAGSMLADILSGPAGAARISAVRKLLSSTGMLCLHKRLLCTDEDHRCLHHTELSGEPPS